MFLMVDGLLAANWSASRRGAKAAAATAANTQALFDAMSDEAKQRAYEIQQQREHEFDERKWFARKCAAIAIITFLLIGAIAHFAKAAEIDLTPRLGETTQEYEARTSGDPAKIEAIRQRKMQETAQEERRALHCNRMAGSVTVSGRNWYGQLVTRTRYSYGNTCD